MNRQLGHQHDARVDQRMQMQMTPEQAAIAYIQSVAPPHIQPQPMYKFYAAKSNAQLIAGGGIDGAIDFEAEAPGASQVKDEVTARHSAQEFSAYLNKTRLQRQNTWQGYWTRKMDLNKNILELEREAFTDSQLQAADYDYSDDEQPKRVRTAANVPVIRPNVGAFDLPKPHGVVIPDPRDVGPPQMMHHQQQQQYQRRPPIGRQMPARIVRPGG